MAFKQVVIDSEAINGSVVKDEIIIAKILMSSRKSAYVRKIKKLP